MTELDQVLAAAIAEHQAGRLEEAEVRYQELLAAEPNHADANHLLGLVLSQRGDQEAAIELIRKAMACNPANAQYPANLGRVLMAAGSAGKAIEAYDTAVALMPDDATLLSDLAAALLAEGRDADAADSARRAIDLAPDLAAAQLNLGLALKDADTGAAQAAFKRAGDFPDARFQLAELAAAADRSDEAEAHYRACLAAQPDMVEAWCNLGNLYRREGRFMEAIEHYRQALTLDAENADILSNLGVAYHEIAELENALETYETAIRIAPKNPELRRNRAMALLKAGRFDEGWKDLEYRWQTRHFDHIRRDWAAPQWDGRQLGGETVLVHHEQGFGDTLQFCRYLPLVAARGGRVIVECPDPLIGLLADMEGVVDVIPGGQALPAHDFHIPMMSLPGAFGTDFETLPAEVPYLRPAAGDIAAWDSTFNDAAFNVGLVWKGSVAQQRNLWRSPGLDVLLPLLDVEGAVFHSLQKDDGPEDLAACGLAGCVRDLSSRFTTFSDTAAAMARLDLIISPDTATAHLAGALARPTWLMVPFAPEWRWFQDREDSPWYPTLRLFRQTTPGDWQGIVREMVAEMAKHIR